VILKPGFGVFAFKTGFLLPPEEDGRQPGRGWKAVRKRMEGSCTARPLTGQCNCPGSANPEDQQIQNPGFAEKAGVYMWLGYN
jgi:hypothetical protein